MKDIIKHILKENEGEIYKRKAWKFFDKVGISKSLPHLDDETYIIPKIIEGYYKEYDNPKKEYVPVTFSSSQTSRLFSDREYNIESMIEKYLDGEYDEYSEYECYDYDHSWMWDDINEENKKIILKNAKDGDIDVADSGDLSSFIDDEYGTDIGCSFADAQSNADTDYFFSDVMSEIDSFYSIFNGKWDFDKGIYVGKISTIDLSKSQYFLEVIENQIDIVDFDWGIIAEDIVDNELDNLGYVESTLLDDKPYIDTDKHFRYGGAGTIDNEYLNEMINDKLTWL